MHRSVLDYRPTQPRWASRHSWGGNSNNENENDERVGIIRKKKKRQSNESSSGKFNPVRMGIEIDGAAHLLERSSKDEARAMRILSLRIAQRLGESVGDDGAKGSIGFRSVAVYFNSLEQSLLASRELRSWKNNEAGSSFLDRIHIHSLGQDSLPPSMIKEKILRGGQQKNASNHGTHDNTEESIIIIVKPTDYDSDSPISIRGNSPSSNERQPPVQANVVDKLQSLLFQASASSIPAVVLSPRLSELPPLQQASALTSYKRTGPSGFEQSGFQKSATYGGIEPPVGPTSWLLRDLVPPIYVWVGCANVIGQRKHSHRSLRSLAATQFRQEHSEIETTGDIPNDGTSYSYYSRVALTQSAMETGHSWHMFAVRENLKPMHSVTAALTSTLRHERNVSYHYIGSSIASRGRPSKRIINDVFEEFCETSAT